MQSSLSPEDLSHYLAKQLNHFFPDRQPVEGEQLDAAVQSALLSAEKCFIHVKNERFWKNGEPFLDHLNSDQCSMFLYWVARAAWQQNCPPTVTTKLYLLNKALHGIDVYYEIDLPAIFLFGHAVGSVLGRAVYGDYFFVSQCCTVGAVGYHYPTMGKGVVLASAVSVVGRTRIGDSVCVGAGALLVNETIDSDMTVVGRTPDIRCWPSKDQNWRHLFFETATPR